MTTKSSIADHKSAIVDLAKTVGINVIYSENNYIELGDDVQANSSATENDGVLVTVSFNDRGEVKEAHKRVNGETKGDVTGTRGNAGQRLLWTLHMFTQRGDWKSRKR